MSKQFQCYECEKVFPVIDEEAAKRELELNFPGSTVEQCETLCDDCYEQIMTRPIVFVERNDP